MSRLKNTILNGKVGVLFHILFLSVQFFSRKVFLDRLGDDFIGTTSTLQAFLGFLNLAELGIGTAIGFVLYKPIFENNRKEINQIIHFLGFIYKRIGLGIIAVAFGLSAFFPLIFSDTAVDLALVYYAFFVFLSGSLFGYFFNYHIFLLQADQKDFVVTKIFQTISITKILFQIVAVLLFESFFLYLTFELISGILSSIFIRRKLKKEYPWLSLTISKKYNIQEFENYPYLVKKIKQISLHKLGTFISSGTNNILIFSFISAQMVTFFGNYNLIISNADLLVTKLFSGTKASVGNLVAENDSEKNNQVFWEFMSLRFYIGGLGFIGIITLMDPFIQVWLGEKYVLSISVSIVFAINFLLGQIRQPVDVFKQGFGLYADTWAPVTQGTINLIISFALAKPLGLTGILLGNTISLLIIVMIWRPYYLYKKGFKVQIGSYIIGFFKHLTLLCVFLFITNFIINLFPFKIKNFTDVGIKVVIVTPLSATIYGLILYTTNQHFRDVIKRLYSGFVNR